jgi:APA family basic amino acid/polyamine antiporter
MKLYPFLPLIFMAAYLFVAVSITLDYRNNHYAAAVGSSVLLLFIGISFIAELIRKSKAR